MNDFLLICVSSVYMSTVQPLNIKRQPEATTASVSDQFFQHYINSHLSRLLRHCVDNEISI